MTGDGWWMTCGIDIDKKTFPSGMKSLTDKIHEMGM